MDYLITRPQMKKIYAMARQQLGWSNGTLHLFLKSKTGKEHISNLTRQEAADFIDELVCVAGNSSNGYRTNKEINEVLRAEGVPVPSSLAQHYKIRYLMADAGWTEGKLKGYLESIGAKELKDLTDTLASNLIERLKSEIRRNMVPSARGNRRGING